MTGLSAVVASLSEDVIVDAVKSLGAQEKCRDERHIWFTTVCHGGDSSKLCYNRDTKTFYCYTECGFMTLPTFFQHALNCSFQSAISYLKSLTRKGLGVEIVESNRELEEAQRMSELVRSKEDKSFEFQALDTHALECFENDVYFKGWLEEGISAETMKLFGIQWDELTKSIVIPHHDMDGKLVGIRARQIEAKKAKYMPLILDGEVFSHPLGMNLYGGYLHKDAIRRQRQALVVEGEKSVMKHHTWFGSDSNAVAVCGFNMTEQQRTFLLNMDVEEVVLAFDKDVDMVESEDEITEEYEHYCEAVNRIGQALAPYCRVTALVDEEGLLELKDSPLDKGKNVFLELMTNRQEIVC